jgi:4-hydroxybenzoate polyprenyltransferase
VAARLGLAMLGLQAAIGALNDVIDAPRDAGLKPGKPIPAGLVSPTAGLLVAGVAAAAGLLLAARSGPGALLLALAILAIGGLYDLGLKGTPLSWLPFALGIPLLPVFGWLGTTGALAEPFVVLLPVAFLAGATLSIANALVDVGRDRSAGVTSIAAALGERTAWRALAIGQSVVLVAGALSLLGWGVALPAVALAIGLPGGLVLAGVALSSRVEAGARERGWQLQAIGIAVLGSTWLVLALPR